MPIGSSLVAGAYTSAYTPASGSPNALGITRDGWIPTFAIHEDRVEKSDQYGNSLIEKFYLGARAGLSCTFMEWNSFVTGMLFPYSTFVSTGAGKFIVANAASPIGQAASSKAGSLVLTVVANTPAAAKPATVTYGLISPVNERDMSWTYDARHRTMSASFECLLYLSTSDYIFYSYT